MYEKENRNIILNQIIVEDNKLSFREVVPQFDPSLFPDKILSIDSSGNLLWVKFPPFPEIPQQQPIPEFHIVEDNRIKETDIFYKDGKVGISRIPLLNYKFDISIPKNTLMTGLHIGDGSFGFSMGNGTRDGFIPEIIGMGSDENDAGLYFLGKAGNNLSSDIPVIIVDARNASHEPITNRPIFGITSGDYLKYKLILDSEGRLGLGKYPEIYKMEVDGVVMAEDFLIGDLSLKALIDVVKEIQEEINTLKNRIKILEQK